MSEDIDAAWKTARHWQMECDKAEARIAELESRTKMNIGGLGHMILALESERDRYKAALENARGKVAPGASPKCICYELWKDIGEALNVVGETTFKIMDGTAKPPLERMGESVILGREELKFQGPGEPRAHVDYAVAQCPCQACHYLFRKALLGVEDK